ncbi:hypothetical protein PF010_g29990 [Phytophthora fragariae]|uniref:Uncharacterized protein n=1 Tax=Phytophthora fragariae TaxID=53985 RepID=A0A6A3Q213_9STRA|nr:hypothetical protein PF010_g29990 [Phytophthora fragariae]KAE9067229.1 hypothetical protein PF006_g30040 [Phytophthora fragariae]KAE9164984.1 hypothetical protein PF004_g29649 [Phytophthora fragariae]
MASLHHQLGLDVATELLGREQFLLVFMGSDDINARLRFQQSVGTGGYGDIYKYLMMRSPISCGVRMGESREHRTREHRSTKSANRCSL